MFEQYLSFTLRLILACVLGGIIGYERENKHRPAGFRTHILVCVGAALVMVTSEFIFNKYLPKVATDPTRLGAQVISGIGFLGAGTIIREGFNVQGLTTAASLWAVSCVGIAAGIGFYEGAIVATILIYVTLIALRKMETSFAKNREFKVLYIQTLNKPGQIGEISNILNKLEIPIKSIEFITAENEKSLSLKFIIKATSPREHEQLVNELHQIEGIFKVYEE